ncbi:MAG: hypothetical protein R3E39_04065 [Anaerolineae bacterium]
MKLIGSADDTDKSDEFDKWLATCCQHPFMDYTEIHIPSWKSYHSLVEALEQVGWEHFPTLKAELPEANEGIMTVQSAEMALKELDYFHSQQSLTRPFLINDETGEPIGASTAGDDRYFNADSPTGLRLGFDEKGFYIVDTWELNRELFRAMRIEQRQVESSRLDVPDDYEFTDVDTGQKFLSSTPLRTFVRSDVGLKQEYPTKMHVEERVVDARYFASVVEPLLTIFQAAVEMGNPVRWG